MHPRGRAVFEAAGLAEHPGIRMCEPLGYLEFMSLVRGAAAGVVGEVAHDVSVHCDVPGRTRATT